MTLVGFGTFSKGRRKARKGRNPQTGAEIKIRGLPGRQIQGRQKIEGRGLI